VRGWTPSIFRWTTNVTNRYRSAASLVSVLCCSLMLSLSAAFAQTKPPDDFKPISELPPAEQLPAGRLLVAAYVVVIVVLFLYLLSVARRLNTVQREVDRLEADVKRTGRA